MDSHIRHYALEVYVPPERPGATSFNVSMFQQRVFLRSPTCTRDDGEAIREGTRSWK